MRGSIEPVGERDLPLVAKFIRTHSPPAYADSTVEDYVQYLRWVMLDNPARGDFQHFGWMLLNAEGNIAGTELFFPQRFHTPSGIATALVSNGSFADAECRQTNQWAFLFNEYRKLSSRHPLFGNTANAFSAPFFRRLGGSAMPGWDSELVTLLRPSALLREVWTRLRRKASTRPKLLASAEALCSVAPEFRITSAAELFEIAEAYSPPGKVRAEKSLRFLAWRYFEKPGLRPVVFRVPHSGRPLAAAVLPFFKGNAGLRALRVLDLFGTNNADIAHVIQTVRGSFPSTLESVVWQPLAAPERRPFATLSWKFSAPRGWFLDPKNHAASADWSVTYADGDAGM